ncbi:MAG: TerB N-terminal domain-containing protein [Bacteroidota bacterium]
MKKFSQKYSGPKSISRQSPSKITSTEEQRSHPGKANFIPANKSVVIQGHKIDGGMIYVGQLGKFPHWDTPRSHINVEAPVAKRNEDIFGDQMNYWPSYSSISPKNRLTYLRWLAGGRRNPEYDIGYVFLFFYGLEYRLLKEQVFEGAEMIIKEVEELRKIYGHNPSFNRYSRNFLDTVSFASTAHNQSTSEKIAFNALVNYKPIKKPYRSYEIPIKLRIVIDAQLIKDGAIKADLALDWWVVTYDQHFPTTVQRVFSELRSLFNIRFVKTYPNGLKFKKPQSRIKEHYRSASGDFSTKLSFDVPDIRNLKAPLRKINKIAQVCIEELKSYSRAMAKCDDGKPSLEAISVLPSQMIRIAETQEINTLRQWISKTANAQYSPVPIAKVFEASDIDYTGKPTAAKLRKVAAILGCVGYEIEPHPDFGGQCRDGQNLILFSTINETPSTSSEHYSSIAHIVSLSVAVANADGTISYEEKQHLAELVAKKGKILSSAEQNRLQAHLKWLLIHPPSLQSLKNKLNKLTLNHKRLMARFALATSAADGQIDPLEVKFLEKLYSLIEVDKSQLYTDLHTFEQTPSDEPVLVKMAESKISYTIPQEEKAETAARSGMVLDLARIEAIRQETHQVSQILSDVFVEPEVEEVIEEIEQGEENEIFKGLDSDHAQLLDELLTRKEWARKEYVQLCTEFSLMAEGAMETINDWALDIHDDVVIEDGDLVVINKELLQKGAAR